MCGIFGIVTDHEQVLGPTLIGAAERLTYRGYDSVGSATLSDGRIDLRKDVCKVDAFDHPEEGLVVAQDDTLSSSKSPLSSSSRRWSQSRAAGSIRQASK